MAYPHGMFSWADIALPDPEAGKSFYAELFGWTTEDAHDPDGNYIYTSFFKDGKAAAGLAPLPPGAAPEGVPPMWTSYITVDDLDAAVAKWTAAGGKVMLPVMDVMTAGRMAVVQDAEGAVVALWQAGDSVGGEIFATHGAISWNELATRDSAAARDFYTAAGLGWEFQQADTGNQGVEYWTIHLPTKQSGNAYQDDDYNGGMITMNEQWPAEIPAHWMVYFQVDDADEIVKKLQELGGSVSVPPFDSSAGRMAVVGDPQGGTFTVISVGESG